MGKNKLVLALEVRWRLVLYYRKRIMKLLNKGEKLCSESVVRLSIKIDNQINHIIDDRTKYEAMTHHVLKFYGNKDRDREYKRLMNTKTRDSCFIEECSK
ncbi:MAG: hypothetical protein K0S18_808 [Anaerocolumna sp.]|jgi:hypothetical protein|nr:hypothetical protein [Anaerocolumna sp.]